jgi:hypothetical protein
MVSIRLQLGTIGSFRITLVIGGSSGQAVSIEITRVPAN